MAWLQPTDPQERPKVDILPEEQVGISDSTCTGRPRRQMHPRHKLRNQPDAEVHLGICVAGIICQEDDIVVLCYHV